jgi:hypothetical protein
MEELPNRFEAVCIRRFDNKDAWGKLEPMQLYEFGKDEYSLYCMCKYGDETYGKFYLSFKTDSQLVPNFYKHFLFVREL